jgi:RNA polymerase sigma-70 factor (ECF subfamily)
VTVAVLPGAMDSERVSDAAGNALTDAELWLASKQGQTAALGQLYDRHAGLVYGIALKVLGNAQEAEDLTQDIFIKLAYRSSYDPQRGSLRTFLAILTRSRALDRVRSRQRESQQVIYEPLLETADASTAWPVDLTSQAEQHEVVQAALSELSDQEQQLLQMAYYEGLTQASISSSLGLPLGTVKSRVRRGLLKLRQVLHGRIER